MNSRPPQQIQSIDTLILDLPPSCIEFWDLHPEYFVIGTYNLEKREQEHGEMTENPSEESHPSRPQERNGSLVLCKLTDKEIRIIHTFPTEYAILDLHFAYEIKSNDQKCHTSYFYTANSTGSIAMYEITFSGGGPSIQQRSLYQLWPKDTLVLSLCLHPTDPTLMSMTLSTGEVYLQKKGSGIHGVRTWLCTTSKLASHSLEAWISCFMSEGKELLLSGGDDGVLQYTSTPTDFSPEACLLNLCSHDYRRDEEPTEILPSIKLPRKFHNAGVTAILPLKPGIILSGSYDDHIRLIRLEPKPSIIAGANLDGGVWRLKVLSQPNENTYDILASCMHAGTRIVRVYIPAEGKSEGKFEVLAKFEEHESMNYGSDFQPLRERKEDQFTVVSTSFYDKRVCLWKFQAATEDVSGDRK